MAPHSVPLKDKHSTGIVSTRATPNFVPGCAVCAVFASLAQAGVAVYGQDHIAHGLSDLTGPDDKCLIWSFDDMVRPWLASFQPSCRLSCQMFLHLVFISWTFCMRSHRKTLLNIVAMEVLT